MYLARPHRYSPRDLVTRAPELAPLAVHEVAVFGLGCLGAPSALEFARASIGGLRLLDGDHVDAATTIRWPFGLGAAGWPKAWAIAGAIRNDYPYVRVDERLAFAYHLGEARRSAGQPGDASLSEGEVLGKMLDGASLLYDACAERAVQYLLAQAARGRSMPYISVQGTAGGWGGMVVCIEPGRTEGCWGCLQHWLGAPIDQGGIPGAPADAQRGEVRVEGCANQTYAGANVDLGEVALMGVRVAMGVLAGGVPENGGPPAYPRGDWDVAVLSLRDERGRLLAPRWETFDLRRHPECSLCGARTYGAVSGRAGASR